MAGFQVSREDFPRSREDFSRSKSQKKSLSTAAELPTLSEEDVNSTNAGGLAGAACVFSHSPSLEVSVKFGEEPATGYGFFTEHWAASEWASSTTNTDVFHHCHPRVKHLRDNAVWVWSRCVVLVLDSSLPRSHLCSSA